jgi:ACS family 4-hydroxyphenylacetate permease-like MFS transporter
VIGMVMWGAHSDKKMERTWHYVLPALVAALGWVLVAVTNLPASRMLGLTCAVTGTYAAFTVFWTLPPQVLSTLARPVGIAFITTFGTLAAILCPLVFGLLRDLTHSWTASVLYVAAMLLVSASLIFLVPIKKSVAESTPT